MLLLRSFTLERRHLVTKLLMYRVGGRYSFCGAERQCSAVVDQQALTYIYTLLVKSAPQSGVECVSSRNVHLGNYFGCGAEEVIWDTQEFVKLRKLTKHLVAQ